MYCRHGLGFRLHRLHTLSRREGVAAHVGSLSPHWLLPADLPACVRQVSQGGVHRRVYHAPGSGSLGQATAGSPLNHIALCLLRHMVLCSSRRFEVARAAAAQCSAPHAAQAGAEVTSLEDSVVPGTQGVIWVDDFASAVGSHTTPRVLVSPQVARSAFRRFRLLRSAGGTGTRHVWPLGSLCTKGRASHAASSQNSRACGA